MSGSEQIGFRPVTQGDLAMLGEWLARPHWRQWWGDPETELGHIRDMVEGRDPHCDPFLILVDGQAEGYIQVWRVGPHQTPEWALDNPWLTALPADAVGVDLSLASPDRLSRGIGSRALAAFAGSLRAGGHDTVIIDPDPDNSRAVACYRKAGFRPVPALEGSSDGVLIMQFQPDSPSQ